ncbi:MAG: RIP metalloprotease RseP [Pelovirga sp.]
MTTVIAGILMLGVLVFVHELGHFVVAKMCGVKVLKFSLGFGPKLVSYRHGETEYLICAVPLGGYVQMLGEGSGADGEAGSEAAADLDRSFALKPVSSRLAIVCAGPLMNLLLPLLILPISFMVGVQMPTYFERQACIGHIVADSDADRAGFMAGDCISAINGVAIPHWNAANMRFVSEAGSPMIFDVERGRQTVQLLVPAENNSLEGMQGLGLLPELPARIGGLAAGMPADRAGLEEGDLIVTIGGQPVNSWYDLRDLIQLTGEQPVTVQVERQGRPLTVELLPEQRETDGDYLLGVAPLQDLELKRFGFFSAVREGAKKTGELIELTLVFIQKLFTGNVSAKNIGGPITVVQIAGQAAQTDIAAILTVLAFISIQLGILNLLPIPILDGGHILFYLVELVTRRPLSLRAREISQQVGLAMLLMLMVLAFYNDIIRLWG